MPSGGFVWKVRGVVDIGRKLQGGAWWGRVRCRRGRCCRTPDAGPRAGKPASTAGPLNIWAARSVHYIVLVRYVWEIVLGLETGVWHCHGIEETWACPLVACSALQKARPTYVLIRRGTVCEKEHAPHFLANHEDSSTCIRSYAAFINNYDECKLLPVPRAVGHWKCSRLFKPLIDPKYPSNAKSNRSPDPRVQIKSVLPCV